MENDVAGMICQAVPCWHSNPVAAVALGRQCPHCANSSSTTSAISVALSADHSSCDTNWALPGQNASTKTSTLIFSEEDCSGAAAEAGEASAASTRAHACLGARVGGARRVECTCR